MSGFSYPKPLEISSIYNPLNFASLESGLTLQQAQARYFPKTGGALLGSMAATGSVSASSFSASSVNGGDLVSITSSATSGRSTLKLICDGASWEVGARGSTAANPNSFYLWNGSFKLIVGPTTTTISNNLTVNGTQQISTTGSHLSFVNGATSGFIEQVASDDILRLVRGSAVNIGANGIRIGGVAAPRYQLDLGSSAADISICTFQSGSAGTYGIGANTNASLYTSGGIGGHRFYYSTVGGSLGTLNATIGTDGTFKSENNLISARGAFLQQSGFSSAGRTGRGLAMHMANAQVAEIFSWDYGSSTAYDLRLGMSGNGMYIQGANGFVCIGSGASGTYPLTVSTSLSGSIPGTYGFLSSGGAGSGSGTGSVSVSAFFSERAWAKEFNAFSDQRLKQNITVIEEADAMDFVMGVEPRTFTWKSDPSNRRSIGYIAQELLKEGSFPELVSSGEDADLEEQTDEDGFTSPAGHRFNVSYQSCVPILHRAIRAQQQMIEANSNLIESLMARIEALEGNPLSPSGGNGGKKNRKLLKSRIVL